MPHALDVRPLRLLALVGAILCCALLAVPALAAADDRYVDKTGTDVANNCLDGDAPCLTIGHAVDEAADDDRVFVGPGVFTESVTTTKSLEFDGVAYNGLPADATDPDENTIWQGVGGSPALTIDAFEVLVAGFTFGDPAGPTDATARGISVLAAPAGGGGCGCGDGYDPAVTFSTFTHLGNGVELDSTSNAYVFFNQFVANDAPTSVAVSGTNDLGTFYMQNLLQGNTTAFSLRGSEGSVVAANQSDSDATFARFGQTLGGGYGLNEIHAPTGDAFVGTGGDEQLNLVSNIITGGGGGDGIHLGAADGPITDSQIAGNALNGMAGDALDVEAGALDVSDLVIANSFADAGGAGLRIADTATDVEAANNWWGCNAGPGAAGCSSVDTPPGSAATFAPWTVMTMLDPDPPAIAINGATSDIGVSFDTNSNGQPIEVDGNPTTGIPDGLDLDFSTTLGTIDTPGCTCGGGGLTTLTSGSTAGTAHVTATLDSQTVSTDVLFTTLSADPASKGFGGQTVGTTSPKQTFTITNAGTSSALVTTVSLQGTNAADFTLFGNGCKRVTLPVGGTCQISAVFSPHSAGAKSAAVRVSGSGQLNLIQLRGSATDDATLAWDASTIDIGTVVVGTTTQTGKYVLHNTTSRDVPVDHFNLTGPDAGDFSVFGGDCLSAPIPAGGACFVGIAFRPSSLGAKTAQVTAITTSGPPVPVTVTGTGSTATPLTFDPSTWDFGTTYVGAGTPVKTFQITNSSSSTQYILHVELSGPDAGDFRRFSGGCLNVPLSPGSSCTVSVSFNPTSDGAKSGQLTVSTASNSIQTIALSGTGASAAPLTFDPASWDFGTVPVGSTSPTKQFNVTNSTGTAVQITNVTLTSGPNWIGYLSGCRNVVLAPGASCAVSARFKPTTAGDRPVQITFTTDAGSPQVIELSGVTP